MFFVSIAIIPVNASVNKISYIRKNVRCLNNGYGVDLSCDDPYYDVPPEAGASATFIVNIKNTGTFDDTYDVTATVGPSEYIICLVNNVSACNTSYPITLEAGESTTFTVTAELKYSSMGGELPVFVEARSQNDTSVSDSLVLIVNILESGHDLSIFLPDGFSKFEFTIKNTGTETLTNIEWTVTFQYLGYFGGRISGSIPDLELKSSERVTIPFHLFGFGPGKIKITVDTDRISRTTSAPVFFLGSFAYFY